MALTYRQCSLCIDFCEGPDALTGRHDDVSVKEMGTGSWPSTDNLEQAAPVSKVTLTLLPLVYSSYLLLA